MASVVKRKSKKGIVYYISYRVPDGNGLPKQYWYRTTCVTEKEAERKCTEVALAEQRGQLYFEESNLPFLLASMDSSQKNLVVSELLEQYVSEYGTARWEASTLAAHVATIRNYINPHIGDIPVGRITSRILQEYYNHLLTIKGKKAPHHKQEPENISARTIHEIHKILRPAFKMAVRDGLLDYNPALSVTEPKQPKKKREQWTGDEIAYALSVCDDELLYLCICLVFACSLRTCELSGLTWDCVEVTEDTLRTNSSCIHIAKELRRINRDAMHKTNLRGIIQVFPSIFTAEKTALVLKSVKNESSERRIFLPDTVARLLLAHKAIQAQKQDFLQEGYHDYGLVIAQDNGNPYEGNILSKHFRKLIGKHNLRPVVFYSLRHSSATEKLRTTHDVKAVQGDTGHSTAAMLQDVYAGILDEDRKKNATLMEESFFNKHLHGGQEPPR